MKGTNVQTGTQALLQTVIVDENNKLKQFCVELYDHMSNSFTRSGNTLGGVMYIYLQNIFTVENNWAA